MGRLHPTWAQGVLLLCLCCRCACPLIDEPPPAVPDGPVAWSYLAVGHFEGQVRVRGFDGALPAGSTLEVLAEETVVATAEADERGRVDLTFDGPDQVELRVSGGDLEQPEQLAFAVHEMDAARELAVNQRLAPTGSIPNHVAVAPGLAAEGDALLLVVSTGDNLVDNLSLSTAGRLFPALLLPERSGSGGVRTAQPFSVLPLGSAAAVSRPGQTGVTLFDIATGTILAERDERLGVILPQPFVPSQPVDGDGDGNPETPVLSLLPRNQQGLAAHGSKLFVSAANLLHTGPPAIYGPGMVLVYEWSGSELAPADLPVLFTSFLNPQDLLVSDGRLIVVETGVIELTSGWQAVSDGGIDIFDLDSLQLQAAVNLGRSAPGSLGPSADGTSVYAGSLLKPWLFQVDLASGQVVRGGDDPIEIFASNEMQAVFSIASHPMGLLFVSSFNTDQVYAVDTLDNSVSPWPFDAPFRVGEGGMAFAGAHALALRPGRNGVDYRGPDLAVLLSLAARIATVDSRHMMGP